jgi:hypothetical protein
MASDLTSGDFALKEHYKAMKPTDMVYKNNPFYALVPKYTKFTGDTMPVPQIYANPQNRSATFSTAIAGTGNTKGVKFNLTRVQDYSIAEISHEAMLASEDNAGAFLKLAVMEIDGAIHSLGRSTATALFRDGTGTIGRIATTATVASATLILSNVQDVVNFEVGMVIGASSALGSGARTGTATISGINRNTGTITTAGGNWSTQISSLATSDYLYVAGDFNKKMAGLDAWVPLADPSATAFFGVDRTQDIVRLSGVRKSVIGLPIEEALTDVNAALCQEGANPSHAFMSHMNYAALEKQMGSRKILTREDVKGTDIGFDGIKVTGLKGAMTVLPDLNCQSDRFYCLQLDTWSFNSLGESPNLFDADGTKMLRSTNADSLQVRVTSYHQLGCEAVGFNGVGQLA